MIIKAKPFPVIFLKWGAFFFSRYLKNRFNKLVIANEIEVKPGHSYLLMCNHFSFLDGFFAYYVAFKYINKHQPLKGIYTMSVKRQMEKNWWLKHTGSFSVEPGTRSVEESLNYAAELLSQPGNLLFYYPQGNLESNHIRHIEFKDGVYEIINRIKGDCQLIWSSAIAEYFESTRPTVYFNLLDCSTNHNFNFPELKKQVNAFHLKSLQRNVRFTKEK